MSKKENNLLSYSMIDDPHMYYFLQSPQKVRDLLKTKLFLIQDGHLVDKKTKKKFKLDQFVLEKVM